MMVICSRSDFHISDTTAHENLHSNTLSNHNTKAMATVALEHREYL